MEKNGGKWSKMEKMWEMEKNEGKWGEMEKMGTLGFRAPQ